MINIDSLNRTKSEIQSAIKAIGEGHLDDAAVKLKSLFDANPDDVNVLRGLAELGRKRGHLKDAAELLRQAIMLEPQKDVCRFELLTLLLAMHRSEEALALVTDLSKRHPDNLQLMTTHASLLMRTGDHFGAIRLLDKVLTREFNRAGTWMLYGHCLKAVGHLPQSITAYREALLLDPAMGDAWWSLANIKTTKFTEEDVEAMTKALEAPDRPQIDRASLHFALAKSIEDTGGEAERSFHHYKLGNEMRRRTVEYDRDRLSAVINGVISIETKEYFGRRIDHGCKRQDPIFIIGMPRSGSTLVEQILASHPMIEATNELHDIAYLANRLAGGQSDRATGGLGYIERLMRLNAGQLSALGEEYLERTKIQRKQDKPLFIDKMPANWRYIGLINLILPNAKIIDTRRHPIDCCWSNYKQHYGSGHANSYDLEDMGHFYMEYVKYLIHIDTMLPSRIYRVIHEKLIQNTEIEVKNLLDYIGVPFNERCLNFWQNDLIVKTPSSEQVRRPINQEGMNQWKKYELWLQPLKNVLGHVVDEYPDVVCTLKSDTP